MYKHVTLNALKFFFSILQLSMMGLVLVTNLVDKIVKKLFIKKILSIIRPQSEKY
jgi:hypothetical protein